jgi:hypothetical protein
VKTGSTYVLGLHDITLSLLSLTFPPSGQTELLLFADPSGQGQTSLGWYAGYAKEPAKKKAVPPARKALPGGSA